MALKVGEVRIDNSGNPKKRGEQAAPKETHLPFQHFSCSRLQLLPQPHKPLNEMKLLVNRRDRTSELYQCSDCIRNRQTAWPTE
jgi:hypothetical protein